MSTFIHTKEDIVDGVIEGRKHSDKGNVKGGKYKAKTFAKFVPGYEICKTCGLHPAYEYDSAKPDQVKVITCIHVTEKPKKI